MEHIGSWSMLTMLTFW